MKYDPLLYGKDQTEHIVGMEVVHDKAYLFQEFPNGEKAVKVVPNRFWILSPYNMEKAYTRLEGNLHFKWGKQYTNRDEFEQWRKKLYPKGIFAVKNPKEALMIKDGYTYFKGSKPSEVSVLSFDIEGTGLNLDDSAKVLLISNTYRSPTGEITRKLFAYDEYPSIGDMIEDWCKWVRETDPSVILGHNIFCYDLPYLAHVAGRYGKSIALGRNESPILIENYESKFRIDGSKDLHYHKCHVWGRELIDTMFLAYRYDVGKKYDSYGLKNIIRQEGLEKEKRVFYDANQIRFKYKNPTEWLKIKEYCKDDADDSLALYDLMIPVTFYLCPVVPKTFQMMLESASGSQINSVLVRSYIQNKHSIPAASPPVEYEGAISFGVPGVYRNLNKIDYSAMYPSIMLHYGVYDEEKDPRGNFLKILKHFAEYRQKYKQLYKETGDKNYDYLQQVAKTIANSCYGFMGTGGLNFNSPEKAAFVTGKGRELLGISIKWATGKDTQYWMDKFKEKMG
jgi:DNA polymerase, archaea type